MTKITTPPPLEIGDKIVLVYMDDDYDPVPIGTKGTVRSVGEDPFNRNEKIYEIDWENGRTLSLVSETDLWLKEDQLNYPLREQKDIEIEKELDKIMPTYAPIPKTKMQAANVIKKILYGEHKGLGDVFYTLGDDVNLETTVDRYVDKIRFFEYFNSFKTDVDGRGFNYEGLLAGLFGGEPIISKNKEDIEIGGQYYSVKLTQPGERYDTGSLSTGFVAAKKEMEDDYIDTRDIDYPIDLMNMDDEYNKYKRLMFEVSFANAKDGRPVDWIFSVLKDNYITYCITSSDELIDKLISSYKTGKGGKMSLSVPHKSVVSNDCSKIIFPTYTPDELKKLRYVAGRELKTDKIAELFGKYKGKIRFDILEYIRKNPNKFVERVIDLYGDRIINILRKKGQITEDTNMKSTITEDGSFANNMWELRDFFKDANLNLIFEFFETLRMSGLVNMFESTQFAFSGPEYLKKFIELEEMRGREFDNEQIEKLLDLSLKVQQELIRITMKRLDDEGKDFDINLINSRIRKLSADALRFFILSKSGS